MKPIHTILVLLITLLSPTIYAQDPLDPGWLWAMRGGSTVAINSGSFDSGYERILDVAVDGDNNYYYLAEVAGYTFTLDTIPFENYNNDSGKKDIFIFSTDDLGNFRWSKTIGGGTYDFASSLGIDAEGNIYVTGVSINWKQPITPVHFDTDSIMPEGTSAPSTANKTLFIIKYDMDGNFQWLRQPEGDETPLFGSGAILKTIVEPNGTSHSLIALIAGTYLDGQLIVPPMDTIGNVPLTQTVIVKYNNAGEFMEYILLDMHPTTRNYWTQLAYDPTLDRYYIAATYTSNDINPDNPLSINGYGFDTPNKAFYMAAVDSQGEVVWYHENMRAGSFVLGDLKIDDAGDVYITGYLSADQGPDNFAGFVFDAEGTGSGSQDPFLVKLDPDGNLLWGTNANLFSPFLGQSIVVSGNSVYLGLGMLDNTWGDLAIPAGTLGSGLTPDIQIVRFDAQTGSALEVIQNSQVHTPTRDAIMAMALDNNGDLVVGGYFGSTLFAGTDLQIQNTGPDSDFFIAKYQPQDTGVGINEASILNKINVYPNPTSGMLNLQSQVAITSYTLCDLQGRVVKKGSLATNQVDLSGLESGVYVLGLRGVDGHVWNTKVVFE